MAVRPRSNDERVSVSFGHGFRASRKPSCMPSAKFRRHTRGRGRSPPAHFPGDPALRERETLPRTGLGSRATCESTLESSARCRVDRERVREPFLFRVHFWSGRFCRLGSAAKSLTLLARPTGIEPVFPTITGASPLRRASVHTIDVNSLAATATAQHSPPACTKSRRQ
jgi:hypothetical protein